MFERYIKNCQEAILLYMQPADGIYYRIVHNPTLLKDITPQALWKYEGLTSEAVDLPQSLPSGCSLEEQWKQVKEYSPSFNLTADGAARMLLPHYKRRKTAKQKEDFLKNKGDTVKAYKLKPNDGWIQKQPDLNGHVVFQPYEDFNLDEHEIDNIPPKPLISFIDEEG